MIGRPPADSCVEGNYPFTLAHYRDHTTPHSFLLFSCLLIHEQEEISFPWGISPGFQQVVFSDYSTQIFGGFFWVASVMVVLGFFHFCLFFRSRSSDA